MSCIENFLDDIFQVNSLISTVGLLVCIRDCSGNPFCGVITEQKDCNEKPDPRPPRRGECPKKYRELKEKSLNEQLKNSLMMAIKIKYS